LTRPTVCNDNLLASGQALNHLQFRRMVTVVVQQRDNIISERLTVEG
jgi:hypothetical protein